MYGYVFHRPIQYYSKLYWPVTPELENNFQSVNQSHLVKSFSTNNNNLTIFT